MPIFWECDRCTACCRWPGQVRLTDEEINRLADHLNLTPDAFIQQYTRLNASRTGLALTDQTDGACVFLDGANCRVNPVKPQQCRDFPNLWNFPGFQEVCRAKPRDVPPDEWRQRILSATGRSVPAPAEGDASPTSRA
jgi:Fe-S-cluster containining protein